MKNNSVLEDICNGKWALTFNAFQSLYPTFNKILQGEKIDFELKAKQLIEFYDEAYNEVKPNKEGFLEIPFGSTVVLNMIGPLVTYGSWWYYGADEIVSQLKKYDENPNVKAILVYMRGPGGSVSAIPPFLQFGNERNKKKPLAVVYDQMCSAHLYAAYGMQPDFVWAQNKMSEAGSLGVMLSFLKDAKWMEMNGLEMVSIYPDESEDKNLPARLALEGKFDLIKKEMLSPLAIMFRNDMIALNPNLKKDESGVLTGKTFYADDAVKVGFAKKIGTIAEALRELTITSELNHYTK
jgi:protease-4